MESSLIENVQETGGSSGMLFACWAIVIVLVAMFLVFMRAHKKEYAVAIVPLIVLPLSISSATRWPTCWIRCCR